MKVDPLQLLGDLVAIPSPSEIGNGPMIDYACSFLKPRGWKLLKMRYRDSNGTEKCNLVALTPRKSGQAPGAELALCGHTDTVGWDPKWKRATKLVERQGRLYGRGTCDMKGFIAAVFAAVADLDVARLDRRLAIVLTADEEVGCIGANRLAKAGAVKAKYAIIGEPTSLRPVRAGKGYGLAEIVVSGREAHSAYPRRGASAIVPAARLISRIEEMGFRIEETRNEFFDPPFTTLNVGTIAGGTAKNIVPGECRFLLEWRPVPNMRPEALVQVVREAAKQAQHAYQGRKITLMVRRQDAGFESPARSVLVKSLEEISEHSAESIAFNSEAPQFQAMGSEVVVWGPGDMRVAHRTEEYLERNEFERSIVLLKAVIARFCGMGRKQNP